MPKPELADWTELEVGVPEAEVPAEVIDAELEVLRRSVAELAPVDHRPAQPEDVVVLDMEGAEIGATQRDYVVEIGSGRLVDEIEAALVGMSVGETNEVEFELADDRQAAVDVTVKEIKEKVLPPLDDDLAKATSEFDTLNDLRGDIEARIREQIDDRIDGVFRASAVDALVHQPYGSYPHECYGLYDAEPDHFGVYVDGIKTHGAGGVARYLDRYVYEPATHAEYLDRFGPETLEAARQRALALIDHPR